MFWYNWSRTHACRLHGCVNSGWECTYTQTERHTRIWRMVYIYISIRIKEIRLRLRWVRDKRELRTLDNRVHPLKQQKIPTRNTIEEIQGNKNMWLTNRHTHTRFFFFVFVFFFRYTLFTCYNKIQIMRGQKENLNRKHGASWTRDV